MLNPIPEGYINTDKRGTPNWFVERCPDHLKADMGNVICIAPIRNNRVIEGKEARRG